jgi:hypothetical protein
MARTIDRVIDYIREMDPSGGMSPVRRQVMIARLQDPPTKEELDEARRVVDGEEPWPPSSRADEVAVFEIVTAALDGPAAGSGSRLFRSCVAIADLEPNFMDLAVAHGRVINAGRALQIVMDERSKNADAERAALALAQHEAMRRG